MQKEHLAAALRSGDWKAIGAVLDKIEASDWPAALAMVLKSAPLPEVGKQELLTIWHVKGHRIREQLDDDPVLFDAMHQVLPAYRGPGLVLYRGENLDRFLAGKIGPAWTPKRDVAEMFARGLQAMKSGGVLLRAQIDPSAIIAGPSAHSAKWLGEDEYSVDMRMVDAIDEIQRYPAA